MKSSDRDRYGRLKSRKLTPVEVRQGLEALERLRKHSDEIYAQRDGKPLRPSLEVIHEMREERDRQLAEALGWPTDWAVDDGDEPSEDS
jgi:hypothetical protein